MLRVTALEVRLFSRVLLRFDQYRGVWGPGWGPIATVHDACRPTHLGRILPVMFDAGFCGNAAIEGPYAI